MSTRTERQTSSFPRPGSEPGRRPRAGGSARRPALVALASAALAALVSAPLHAVSADASTTPALTTVKARSADSLNMMSGVNVHLLNGQTPYADFPQVQRDLAALGVRGVRELMALDRPDHYEKLNALAAMGIKTTLVLDPDVDTTDLAARLDTVARDLPTAVEAIEPANEWNLRGGVDWATELRRYQHAMYDGVRSRAALAGVKVLAPALGRRSGFTELGDLSAVADMGNYHLYPGGQVPTNRLDEQRANVRLVVGNKPQVITEMGYHNALNTAATHFPTSEKATAAYVPRLFLEHFVRGTKRAYLYQLRDERSDLGLLDHEAHFGLVAHDGRRKPAFSALRNLLALTSDRGAPFTTGSLSYAVSAPTGTTVASALLQRRNGTFLVALWRDIPVWDPRAETDLAVTSSEITLHLGRTFAGTRTFRPTVGAAPVSSTGASNAVRVPLSGDLTVVELTP